MHHQTLLVAVILIFSFVQAKVDLPPELLDYIKELHDTCVAKTGFTEDQHKAYEMGTKDPAVMCYMECMMLQGKWMSADKTIQYDFIEDSAHPSYKGPLMVALEKCKDIPAGTQQCEKAYNFNDCMFKADPENWYLL